LLVDVVDPCLSILLDSMFRLAPYNCSLPGVALDFVDTRNADEARNRHAYQSHPRPVAGPAPLYMHRAPAH
jgi:hypothetical protein